MASAAAVASSSMEALATGMAGEVTDQGLKIEQGFQTALGNFCLIGRVGGVPRGVFQNIALDNAGVCVP